MVLLETGVVAVDGHFRVVFRRELKSDPKAQQVSGQHVNPVEGMRGVKREKSAWADHSVILPPEKNSSLASPQQIMFSMP
ncbi:hypothetical protein TNCV_4441901 [Trichonephila clavipes]|nr:hypothetical protein TNCV_4441901 [Trichonephila clavipes]